MRRTKKSFLTHYEERYIVIDFYHGKRGTVHSGYFIESVAEIISKASLRGGFCLVYPDRYSSAVKKCVEYIEGSKGLKQGISNGTWDAFHANINAFIADVDTAK